MADLGLVILGLVFLGLSLGLISAFVRLMEREPR